MAKTKMKEREFYSVKDRKRVTVPATRIGVKQTYNPKTSRSTCMMVGDTGDGYVYKIISPSNFEDLLKKYGRAG